MFIKVKNPPQNADDTLPLHRNHPDQIDSPKQKSTPEHSIEYDIKNQKHKPPARQQSLEKNSPMCGEKPNLHQKGWHTHLKQSTPWKMQCRKESGACLGEA